MKKSKGNYIVDADGQTLLDMCGTEVNPLGYNHEAFVKVKIRDLNYVHRNCTAKNSIQL